MNANGEVIMQPVFTAPEYQWHTKPEGTKGPCPVCGCAAKRLKAKHRKTGDGAYEKKIRVCFGTDWTIDPIDVPGRNGAEACARAAAETNTDASSYITTLKK